MCIRDSSRDSCLVSLAFGRYGAMSGRELQITLSHVLADFPVVVRTGKGYVEACHKDVNKGAMAQRMVELLSSDGNGPLDFVLCVGDDSTDELMFNALNQKVGKTNPKLFTVTIGRKPSEASRYLDSFNDIVQLLDLFCTIGFRQPGATLGAKGGSLGGMKKSSASIGGGLGGRASFTNLSELA